MDKTVVLIIDKHCSTVLPAWEVILLYEVNPLAVSNAALNRKWRNSAPFKFKPLNDIPEELKCGPCEKSVLCICHLAIMTMIIFLLPSCLREEGDRRSLRSTFLH